MSVERHGGTSTKSLIMNWQRAPGRWQQKDLRFSDAGRCRTRTGAMEGTEANKHYHPESSSVLILFSSEYRRIECLPFIPFRHRKQRSAAVLGRSKREAYHLPVEAAGSVVHSCLEANVQHHHQAWRIPPLSQAGRQACASDQERR